MQNVRRLKLKCDGGFGAYTRTVVGLKYNLMARFNGHVAVSKRRDNASSFLDARNSNNLLHVMMNQCLNSGNCGVRNWKDGRPNAGTHNPLQYGLLYQHCKGRQM